MELTAVPCVSSIAKFLKKLCQFVAGVIIKGVLEIELRKEENFNDVIPLTSE